MGRQLSVEHSRPLPPQASPPHLSQRRPHRFLSNLQPTSPIHPRPVSLISWFLLFSVIPTRPPLRLCHRQAIVALSHWVADWYGSLTYCTTSIIISLAPQSYSWSPSKTTSTACVPFRTPTGVGSFGCNPPCHEGFRSSEGAYFFVFGACDRDPTLTGRRRRVYRLRRDQRS